MTRPYRLPISDISSDLPSRARPVFFLDIDGVYQHIHKKQREDRGMWSFGLITSTNYGLVSPCSKMITNLSLLELRPSYLALLCTINPSAAGETALEMQPEIHSYLPMLYVLHLLSLQGLCHTSFITPSQQRPCGGSQWRDKRCHKDSTRICQDFGFPKLRELRY